MELKGFVYTPEAYVTFTRREVKLMMILSANHYDAHCREAGQHGGFLYGISNGTKYQSHHEVRLGLTQVDTLCKVTEELYVPQKCAHELHLNLMKLGARLNEEYARYNPRS